MRYVIVKQKNEYIYIVNTDVHKDINPVTRAKKNVVWLILSVHP